LDAPENNWLFEQKENGMLEIAEMIAPTPTPVWKLAKQAGVDLAVSGLPFDYLEDGEAPWD